MFGFATLANASKRFEYAVQSNAPETGMRAADLISAVQEALTEIEHHLTALNKQVTLDEQGDLPAATAPQESAKPRRTAAGVLIPAR